MTASDSVQKLAGLFMETGEAHHKAFHKTDGVDPEWPLWYAEYLHDKLKKFLNADLTKSEIIYLCLSLEKERALKAPGAKWPFYYAKVLIKRYV
jgi:hypothetical protein